MRNRDAPDIRVRQLIEQFLAIALEQDHAILYGDNSRFNRLFDKMHAVKNELKAMPGDQRRALLPLLQHPNAQVRLKSALATLSVDYDAARQALQILSDRNEYPQAADARGMMSALDAGTYRPS